jgi:hypothetical protein
MIWVAYARGILMSFLLGFANNKTLSNRRKSNSLKSGHTTTREAGGVLSLSGNENSQRYGCKNSNH